MGKERRTETDFLIHSSIGLAPWILSIHHRLRENITHNKQQRNEQKLKDSLAKCFKPISSGRIHRENYENCLPAIGAPRHFDN